MATAASGNAAVGTVRVVIGEVKVIGVDGVARQVQIGDKVFAKETIQTAANAVVQVQLENGRMLDLGRDSKIALDDDVLNVGQAPTTVPAPTQDIAALQAQIAAGADPSKVAEATAAGGAPGAGGGADGGGGTGVVIDQANSSGNVTSGFGTDPAGIGFPDLPPGVLPTPPVTQTTPVPPTIPPVEPNVVLTLVVPENDDEEEGPVGAIVDGDTMWLKEDGSGGEVSISASSSEGSSLSTIVITGFKVGDGWSADNYDFSALDTDGEGGVSVSFDVETGTLTITGLSGTSYNGTFGVTPPADSDNDLGDLLATVTAVSDFDPEVTAQASDTVTVNTDAVLDEGVTVAQDEIPEVNESAETQIVDLNLNATSIAPFNWSGAGGDDTDSSESVTVTVTLSAGVLMSDGEVTDTTFTGTADEVVAWLESLQVLVAGNFDGTINGTVSISATDAETDSEYDSDDNVKSTEATFGVTVVDGVPSQARNDIIIVEEESVPTSGGVIGNDEQDDGLSYRELEGTFFDNADWGADGFGGIVSVNGVEADEDGVITITNAAWTLSVNASDGTYTFTMLDNIVGPTANDGETEFTLPVFNVVAQDGDGDPIDFSLTVNVVDDMPVSFNDYNGVATAENTLEGNVFDNDSIGADSVDNPVTSVSFNGETTTVGTNTVIEGTYGTLTISKTGAYSYEVHPVIIKPDSLSGAVLYGEEEEAILSVTESGTTLLVGNVDGTDDWGTHNGNDLKKGFGVTIDMPSSIEEGEALVVKLAQPFDGAMTINAGELNQGQNSDNGADAHWYAFDASGNQVGSGDFSDGTANGTFVQINITESDLSGPAQYLVFTYTTNAQGYTITSIEYEQPGIDDFAYTITDADGDTSSAHLYLGSGGSVTGDEGANTLSGSVGNDLLTGGLGADTFVWNSGDTGLDAVTDFSAEQGDVLDVAELVTTDGLVMTAIEADGHLQLQFSSGATVVQTIDMTNLPVGSNTEATALMNDLLTASKIIV
jgi:VCBS repeat-containing protein